MEGDILSKNICFRVDSSYKIGNGHVVRCLVLAKLFSNAGYKVSFLCRDLPGNIALSIKEKGYFVYLLPFSEYQKKDYLLSSGLNDYFSLIGVPISIDIDETKPFLEMESPSYLIVDHYSIDANWEVSMRPFVQKIMVIDDLANRNHDCDVLLDYNYHLNYKERYQNLVPDSCLLLLGLKHALINPQLTKVKRARENSVKNFDLGSINNIVVFLSGTDPKNDSKIIIDQALASSIFENTNIHVVLGSNNQYKCNLKKEYSRYDNIIFHVQPDYYYHLLETSDLAIGAGGVAQVERLYIGLPSVVLPIAANQKSIYDDMLRNHLIYSIGFLQGKCNHGLSKINVSLFKLESILEDTCPDISIRFVELIDCSDIYQWRTSHEVNQFSLNSKDFSYEEHTAWFKEKMNSNNNFFYIFEDAKTKLGVVRFDLKDNLAIISIYLNPLHIGKGVGIKILDLGIREFRRSCPGLLIIAEILSHNVCSMRLFEKAGFQLQKYVYRLEGK